MSINLCEDLLEKPLKKEELKEKKNFNKLKQLFQEIIIELGEDPTRQGLQDTADRAAKSLLYLTSGYSIEPKQVINNALFDCDNNEMVIVKDLELFSICEHHLLPFIGKCHIGYIPSGKIVGLSKIARIVDIYAKRLQVQENLTQQIANALLNTISAQGVIVIIEAMHLCMVMRGVEKSSAMTKTFYSLGTFKENFELRQEFLQAVSVTSELA